MRMDFREVSSDIEMEKCAAVIRDAFKTVAEDLKITKESAPTNPAFLEKDSLIRMKEKGIVMFGVFENSVQIGFVAIEKADTDVYYMEKLAVLPEFRHKGCGRRIMDFVFDYVSGNNGKKVSIALINENSVLINWYIDYGFTVTGTKRFNHLPFEVCFMEKPAV